MDTVVSAIYTTHTATYTPGSDQVAESLLLHAFLLFLLVQQPVQMREVQLEYVAHHDRAARRRNADRVRVAVCRAPRARPHVSANTG